MRRRPCKRHRFVYSGEARTPPKYRSCARCAYSERRGIINNEAETPSDRLMVRFWETNGGDYETDDEVRVIGGWGVPLVDRFTCLSMRSA